MFIATFGLCWLWYWFTTWGLRVYLFCSRCDLLDFFSLLCGVVVGFVVLCVVVGCWVVLWFGMGGMVCLLFVLFVLWF